jgi:regulator of protease activity HflC (stomatin/prohibitin superfamily)
VTKDRQTVTLDASLIVQVDPSQADKTYHEYRDSVVDTLIVPRVLQALKAVTVRYNAADQVLQRDAVQQAMLAEIQHVTVGTGVLVGANALNITNFKYADAYQETLEATAVAQQKRVQAQAELQVAQTQALTKVATARGDADATALSARTVTPKTIQLEWIKKWDGKMPAVMGSGTALLDLNKMLASQ